MAIEEYILTDEHMTMLEACQTDQDWANACDQIKAESPSGCEYPSDWWKRVKQSGLMARVMSRWNGSSELTVVYSGGESFSDLYARDKSDQYTQNGAEYNAMVMSLMDVISESYKNPSK
jgi:hypothetical protein